MSKVAINEQTLTDIGNAIREKNRTSALIAPGAMADAIRNIQSSDLEMDPIVLTGDCEYLCNGPIVSQYIKFFGNTITTVDITKAASMFIRYQNKTIPFDLNFKLPQQRYSTVMMTYCFAYSLIEELPKFNNLHADAIGHMFYECKYLREIPDDFFEKWDKTYYNIFGPYDADSSVIFQNCYSLRKMPISDVPINSSSIYQYSLYYNMARNCYVLDELIDIPTGYTSEWTDNAFQYMVSQCARLKNGTFATNPDGTPRVAKWKNQLLNFDDFVGFAGGSVRVSNLLNYNSGITADKEVKDDITYQALKNDPDWFTSDINYSRYNHDSAVNTINSLPDTSAYLTANGGTNIIKFRGQSGALTDGGAINTLTEEEIAVATEKGWTVTLL